MIIVALHPSLPAKENVYFFVSAIKIPKAFSCIVFYYALNLNSMVILQMNDCAIFINSLNYVLNLILMHRVQIYSLSLSLSHVQALNHLVVGSMK